MKHKSTKAEGPLVKFQPESLSDKEDKEPPATTKSKSRFGFGKSKKRSISTDKTKSLVSQEIYQMEQDLLAIELKIGNSENLKNMIQEDYYDKKEKYRDAYFQLDELKKFKEEAKNQM